MTTKKTTSSKITLDMTGVESSSLIPEGDYTIQVAKVEKTVAESSGKPTLKWEFQITDEGKSGKLYYNTSLQPQALFNLKNLLLCLGVPVPNGKLELDLDDLIDRECGATVSHEVYDGKKKSRISDIFPLEEESDEEAEEDEEDEEVEEDEEEEEEDETPDYDALSKIDLKELCRTRKIKVSKEDDKKSLIAKLEAADEEEDV